MGVQLTFYPRGDKLLPLKPGKGRQVGLPPQWAGRIFDAATRSHPAAKEPFSCDSVSALGRNCLKQMRSRHGRKDPPLWCADKQTAAACGGAHQPVKPDWIDGEWVVKTTALKKDGRG